MDENADKKALAADYMQSLRWFAHLLWDAIPIAFAISVVAQLLPAFIPALRILLVKELVDSLHVVYGEGAVGFDGIVPILAMMVGLHIGRFAVGGRARSRAFAGARAHQLAVAGVSVVAGGVRAAELV